MGDNTLNTAIEGTVIPVSDVNKFKTAMTGDIVPRNASGVATDQAGSNGTSVYAWFKSWVYTAHVATKQIFGLTDGIHPDIKSNSENLEFNTYNGKDYIFKIDNVEVGSITELGIEGTQLRSLSVGSGELATNSVTSEKIVDSNITTVKINDNAVTPAKLSAINSISTAINLTTPLGPGVFQLTGLALTLGAARPVMITLTGNEIKSTVGTTIFIEFYREAVLLEAFRLGTDYQTSLVFVDVNAPSGLNNYFLKANIGAADQAQVLGCNFKILEL
jgi:hypothetical protein